MNDEVKKLLEEQGRAFEEFKSTLTADGKKSTAESQAKIDTLNAELTRVGKELKAKLDEVEKLAARPRNPGIRHNGGPEMEEYKSGLFGYIRRGDEGGLRDLEKKAAMAGSNPDGGYTVHPELDTAIDRVARSTVAMRGLATVRTIGSRSFKKQVTVSGAAIGGWGNETTSPTETGTPRLKELEFTPGTLWAEPRATQELLEDSDQNIEGWLADEVGITFEEQENYGFIWGDGIDKPRGWLSYPMVANADYAFGSVGYVKSGAAADFATPSSTVSPIDAFTDLMHALKPVYRANASWLMNDATVARVRKFKDGQGNLQWKPGAAVDQPYVELFLGKPINYDDQMPDVEADAFAVAFADWKRAYLIVDRLGTQVIRDALTAKPYVKFYTRRRVGGGIQNFEAIKAMKTSA